MTETSNPYRAPDAVLDSTAGEETYEPSVFSSKGRIGRMRFIAYMTGIYLVTLGLLFVIGLVSGFDAFANADFEAFSVPLLIGAAVFYIGLTVVAIVFGKRRLNDLNRSGWWLLLFFAPGILSAINEMLGLVAFIPYLALTIYMLFFSGSSGSNNYGPAPAANSTGVLILAWLAIAMLALAVVGMILAILIPQFAGA